MALRKMYFEPGKGGAPPMLRAEPDRQPPPPPKPRRGTNRGPRRGPGRVARRVPKRRRVAGRRRVRPDIPPING
jgi:hypothetical protein